MSALFSGPAVEWIVAFLGNPGPKYANTRHNAGFMAADAMCGELGISIDRARFQALTQRCKIAGHPVLLLKPQTYMNLSGDAVSQAMRFYKVPTDHVLVVSDDVSLDAGRLRVRRSGSAGGHNGLKDIIAKCGGEGFPRVKIGVGQKPHPDYDMIDWVLGSFQGKDREAVADAAKRAAGAVQAVIKDGVDAAMNRFNN